MGDSIEPDTSSRHIKTFYCVSASALSFEVNLQTEDTAELYFMSALHFVDTLFFKITLGARSYIEIRGDVPAVSNKAKTEDICSGDEWRQFWVTWSNRRIRVGRAGEATPFVELRKTARLEQIKYFIPGERSAKWRFELGPILPKSKKYDVRGGDPVWMEADEGLPLGAVIGGHENEPLHIIRAKHRGSVTPGKFVPSEGTGYISWGGTSHSKENFEVLVGYNLEWVLTSQDRIPVNALPGGNAEYVNRETLFVGRAEIDGHMIVGKVQPSHKVLYIPYQGREIAKSEYEILVKPIYGPVEDSRKVTLVRKPSSQHGHGHIALLGMGDQEGIDEEYAFYDDDDPNDDGPNDVVPYLEDEDEEQ